MAGVRQLAQGWLLVLLLVLAAAVAAAAASLARAAPAPAAAPLNDPMRPPLSMQPSAPAAAGSAPAAGAGNEAMPVLQGTRRNQQGTWLALLDGRWRAVGERHGEAVVSAVRATEVQLSLGSQRVTIKLQAALPQANGMTTGSKQERP